MTPDNPSREPDWDLYRSLLAVLDDGSLSAAARTLGLTQPTLGRHIEALEADLGAALFSRSPQGLTPTEAALRLRPYAEAMRSAADALRRAAGTRADVASGTVRITASEVMGAEVLPSIIADLRARHPNLTVEIALSNTVENLLQREADIAVRMVAPTQGALLAKRIGLVELGFFARPDYLAEAGTPKTMADLAGHALIGFDRETALTRRLRATGLPIHRGMFAFRTDSDLAQLAAIRAGVGIGVCQTRLAARVPKLTRVLRRAFALSLETWVVMHEDLRGDPRCRVTFDALAAGLGAYLRGPRLP